MKALSNVPGTLSGQLSSFHACRPLELYSSRPDFLLSYLSGWKPVINARLSHEKSTATVNWVFSRWIFVRFLLFVVRSIHVF